MISKMFHKIFHSSRLLKLSMFTMFMSFLLLFYHFCIFVNPIVSSIEKPPIKILSFDGGGVRGVVSIEILKAIERNCGKGFHKNFDVLAGTSTGVLICSLLALGQDTETICLEYENLSKEVFKKHSFAPMFSPKYSTDPFKMVVEDIFHRCGISKETRLKDIPFRMVFTGILLDDQKKDTWKIEIIDSGEKKYKDLKLLDTILSCTAAPTYFSSHNGVVDGGIFQNNPSLVTMINFFDGDLSRFKILSLGTGYTKKKIVDDENWGLEKWFFRGNPESGTVPLISLFFDTQIETTELVLHKLLGKKYRRIDINLKKDIKMDDFEAIPEIERKVEEFFIRNPLILKRDLAWIEKNILI